MTTNQKSYKTNCYLPYNLNSESRRTDISLQTKGFNVHNTDIYMTKYVTMVTSVDK